eukprot:UN12461
MQVSSTRYVRTPGASNHVPRVILTSTLPMTNKVRSITHDQIKTHNAACANITGTHFSTQQSHHARLVPSAFLAASSGTFNSLFKVLFIFPHGTCLLSVSNSYLA